ncbi:7355_t:CDS:1 [Cetraspora pellucida]|uniref:7355_t:CDS:1 n=1 Tax=Cetraspora pellucida TaxID=1433469 RepID=A0A9N8ZR48_9GLOM|nr:7355_t:CDS:1 [Cetraspora pellucida]
MNGVPFEFINNTLNNISIQTKDNQQTSISMFNNIPFDISNQIHVQKINQPTEIQPTEIQPTEMQPTEIQSSNIETIENALFGISRNEIYNPIVTANEIIDDLISSSFSKADNKKIKRPLNKFMVFKKNFNKLITTSKNIPRKHRMREITSTASKFWNNATSIEKEPFEKIAHHVKKLHKKKFPSYSYAPNIKKPHDPFINLTGISSNIGPVPIDPEEGFKEYVKEYVKEDVKVEESVNESVKEDVEESVRGYVKDAKDAKDVKEGGKQPIEEQRPSIVSFIPQQENSLINQDYLFEGQQCFIEDGSLVCNEVVRDTEGVTPPYYFYDPYSEPNNDMMLHYIDTFGFFPFDFESQSG